MTQPLAILTIGLALLGGFSAFMAYRRNGPVLVTIWGWQVASVAWAINKAFS